jgi:hypothetical protein
MMDPRERGAELEAIADRLRHERPVPRAGFRSELRSRLLAARTRRRRARPQGLRVLIAAYAGSGTTLLLFALLGVAGSGPLAP